MNLPYSMVMAYWYESVNWKWFENNQSTTVILWVNHMRKCIILSIHCHAKNLVDMIIKTITVNHQNFTSADNCFKS